jgi:hypothetical protein
MLKKQLLAILGVLGLLALLSACGSKTDANESNFTEALNQYFEKEEKHLCFWLGKMPRDFLESKRSFDSTGAELDALVAAGLLTSEDVEAPHPFNSRKMEKAKRYTPTDAAKPFLREMKGSSEIKGFCWGKKRVDKIVKWTEPESTMGGPQRVEVFYTYKIADMPDWAKNEDIQKFFDLKKDIEKAEKKEERAVLRLMNIGWEAG